jgi:hypothetical protein
MCQMLIVALSLTERRGRVVNTTASYSEGPGVKSRTADWLSWPGFSWFCSVLSGRAGIVPQIRPRPIPSTSSAVNHSLVMLSFDVI